jgi:hypothetical protein
MAGAKIALSSTAGELQTDGNSNALVNLPGNSIAGVPVGGGTEAAGFVCLAAEVDTGLVTGARVTKELEVSDDFRLRVGTDTLQFNLSFEGAVVARDRLQQNDTTMSAVQGAGFLSINSASAVASGNACNIRTYKTFPLLPSYTTHFHFWIREANHTASGAISEWGAGYATGTALPTDGVFLRRLSGGGLRLVVNFNTFETAVDITTTNIPSRDGVGLYDPTEVNHWIIYIHNNITRVWCNDYQVASLQTPSFGGSPNLTSSVPMFARVYNNAAASAGRRVELAYMGCNTADLAGNKPYGHVITGNGGSSVQIQPGTTSGSTVSRGAGSTGWPTSATARAAGTWTATTAPAINSLGGQWLSPAISTLTSEADYPVFAYVNPLGTKDLPGKNLYITGIDIGKTVATTVAATNNILLNYIIGVGATTVATTATEAAASAIFIH